MKVIDIPEPVVMDMGKGPNGNPIAVAHTLLSVLEQALDMHEPLGKGYKNIVRAMKIHGKIEEANKSEAQTIDFEDDEYETVKNALEAAAWKPKFARHLGPIYEAVMKAKDVVV